MMNLPEDLLKLLLAILVGGLIGIEREFRHKVAGFRTNIFICVGATLFTVFAERYSAPGDAVHIIANIVSGVGFIGAGVILRQEGRIVGLTTAAIIWLSAALGMGIGTGDYPLVGVATVGVMVILWIFPGFEKRIDQFQEARNYEFVSAIKSDKLHQLEAVLREYNLQLRSQKRVKRGDKLICTWDIWGSCSSHEQFVEKLLADVEIEEFRF
jgi:putative Mg2+ transporter-C (MgtC) family protein